MPNLFVGVDVGGSHISSWVVDEKGQTYDPFLKIGINSDIRPSELVDRIIELTAVRFNSFPYNSSIVAVSIASPGPLDPNQGVIISPPNLPKIKDIDIAGRLQSKMGLPVFLVNDADAALIGEIWLGAARGIKNVVMLTLGTGVGSSIIAGGRLHVGRGMGGEWGHTTLFVSGDERPCSCGRFNCLEAFLGTNGLITTYSRLAGESEQASVKEILEIDYVLNKYCAHLAEGLVNIINVHHPERIILGGGLASEKMAYMVKAQLMVYRHTKLAKLIEGVDVKKAQLIDNTIGAARYAMLRMRRAKTKTEVSK